MCENRRILLINQSRSGVSSARLLSTNQQYCSQDIGARSVLRCPHFKRLLTILTPHAIYITWNSYTLNIIFIYSSYVGITFANSHEKCNRLYSIFVIDIRAKGIEKYIFFFLTELTEEAFETGKMEGERLRACEIDIPIIFEAEPYAGSRNSNSLVVCGAADYRWRRTWRIYIYIYRVINEHADRCTLGQPSRALLRPSPPVHSRRIIY